jgi:hypothetical protein
MKAVSAILALVLSSAACAGEIRPVVVELFTSQGCSSCPPADRLLGELARRRDVVALGFHVTYWDGAAWRDPLSRRQSTDRQIAYDRRLTGGQVYTPQMIVDGTIDLVGSDRAAVLAALAKARPEAIAPVSFAADRRTVAIGAAPVAGAIPTKADVLLARFVPTRTTAIGGGENASRTAVDSDAVVELTTLGAWTGGAASFPITPPGDDEGLAVLVQAPDGRMLGAAVLQPPA